MKLSKKIKAIRIAEGLTQIQFCKIIELSENTLQKYESGAYEPSGINLVKLTQNPRFEKYTLWLMTGKTAPEAGFLSRWLCEIKNKTESTIIPHRGKELLALHDFWLIAESKLI